MQKVRKSNIELMRIIAMLFIISHHFLTHGMNILENENWSNFGLLSINSICYIGVNVFVLISGYCGIRFDWKKLLQLYLLTAIIGGICYIAHLFMSDMSLGRSIIYHTVFSISHANTWFIKIYIYLFMLSPIINAALQSFDQHKIKVAIILLTIISAYFGWFWQDDINSDGCNVINFIWIYCIGYYLSHFFDVKKIKPIIYCITWIVSAILNAFMAVTIESYMAWTYSNPLVVISAISFFLFLLSFDFYSKAINTLATCTLGVYLIHENRHLADIVYGEQLSQFYSNSCVTFILSVLSLYLICSLLDYMIRKLLVSPLYNVITRLSDKLIKTH